MTSFFAILLTLVFAGILSLGIQLQQQTSCTTKLKVETERNQILNNAFELLPSKYIKQDLLRRAVRDANKS